MISLLSMKLGALRLACSSKIIVAARNMPARGTKPLPRHLWDMADLEEKSEGKYTHKPLRINRLEGRDPETGRKVNQHIGGGVKFDFFMIDFHRRGPTEQGQTYYERVLEVRRCLNRTCHVARLLGYDGTRWILATENMKAGDIVSTSGHLAENPVIGVEGSAYPIGSLVAGTVINSIERYPTLSSEILATEAAELSTTIVRHQGDFTVVKLPHKHEFSLHRTCMATVGKLSHADIDGKIFGSARMRWGFGFNVLSRLFHKKDGYFGRKIRALLPVRVLDTPPAAPPPAQKFTLSKADLSGLHAHAKVHNLIPSPREPSVYHGRMEPITDRFLLPLELGLSGRAMSGEVLGVVDSGSKISYLSEKTLSKFIGDGNVTCEKYLVALKGEAGLLQTSVSSGHFAHLNLWGVDLLRKLDASIKTDFANGIFKLIKNSELKSGCFCSITTEDESVRRAMTVLQQDRHVQEKFGKLLPVEEIQRIRVLFQVKGNRGEGVAQAEMEQRDGGWQWRFLYVENLQGPKSPHVLIDNR